MALSGNFNTNKYYTNSSGSIGLNLSWTATQDIATNSTTISWVLKSNGSMSTGYCVWGGPITATINGENVYYQSGRSRVYGGGAFRKTGTIVVQHDNDGTKSITMSVRAALYNSEVNCTGSASYTLDPIQRYAYISDAENFTDEGNPVLSYANPLGDTLTSVQACLSLDGTTPVISYRDIDKNGTSYTFNLTTAERNSLLSATPNSSTLDVYFIIKSVLYGETYYATVKRTMTVINANPTITGLEYYDTNSDTIAITGDDTKIVQLISTVEFKFALLSALKYATLTSVSIEINGATQTVTLSGSSQSNITKLFGTLNVSSSIQANIELVDSRGNKLNTSITVVVLQWAIPSAIIDVSRINNFYTETNLKVRSTYSSLDGNNNVTVKYQTKKVTDQNYGSLVTIQDNTNYVINLDNAYEWNVKIIITDLIGGTVSYIATVGKGIPIIFFDRLLRSMSINCFPTHQNSIEVDGDILSTNPIGLSSGGTGANTAAGARTNLGIGCSLLLSTPLTSGSTTIDVSGYNTLLLVGKGGSATPSQTVVVPVSYLSSSEVSFSFTHGYQSQYTYIYMSINDNIVTIRFGGGQGSLQSVYGVN